MAYHCLGCGSDHGEPSVDDAGGAVENWWWQHYAHGRVGPFCSEECAREFRQLDQRFSLAEIRRMEHTRAGITEADTHGVSVVESRFVLRRNGPDGEPILENGQPIWDHEVWYREVEA